MKVREDKNANIEYLLELLALVEKKVFGITRGENIENKVYILKIR